MAYLWGNGIEAEFALIRNPLKTLNKKKIRFYFFDSRKNKKRYLYTIYKTKKQDYSEEIKEAMEFSDEIEKELAGKVCLEEVVAGKNRKYVYYLLETKTPLENAISFSNYGKKYIEWFSKNLQGSIQKVIKNYTKYRPDYEKQEDKKIGAPMIFPYGMSSRILLRNLNTNEYKNGPTIENYTGSYHFTFTLPFKGTPNCKKQADNHKYFANLIQWIEPLIGSAYHSCDDRSVRKRYTKGSYRVAMTGWGNFGGSDLHRIRCLKGVSEENLERETLYKYSYRDPMWRKEVKFKDIHLLDPCRLNIYGEKGDSLGGDFRTPYYQYVKGYKKYYFHGLEIRIFDWFHPKHLGSLSKILVMLAEHSRNNRVDSFVYDDKDWNEAVKRFMLDGWCAIMPKGYIKKLEKVFNFSIKPKTHRAHDVFEALVLKLNKETKNGLWRNLMSNTKTLPKIPKVNQQSWEFAFVQYLMENGLKLNMKDTHVLEFLKSQKLVKLEYDLEGNITSVTKLKGKLDLMQIFKKLLRG